MNVNAQPASGLAIPLNPAVLIRTHRLNPDITQRKTKLPGLRPGIFMLRMLLSVPL